jgi:beta-galactosidase/evolved beta-galactosidase subunit alpha
VWRLEVDGALVASGSADARGIGPGTSAERTIDGLPAARVHGRAYLLVSLVLARETAWAAPGHEVAWSQFPWPAQEPVRPRGTGKAALDGERAECALQGGDLVVRTAAGTLVFDAARGRLAAWTCGGTPLLRSGPTLDFWRAPTDNDIRGSLRNWRETRVQRLVERTDAVEWSRAGPSVRVAVRGRIAPPSLGWGIVCAHTYTALGNGDLRIDVEGTPEGRVPRTLPRIGWALALPAALDRVAWFGRGPGESYPDSHMAARFGLYRAAVDELLTPYVFPQENGNRSDVSWVTFTDVRGAGLRADGLPVFHFSAHRFTAADFQAAAHTCDLVPRDAIIVHLDLAQHGLGTASCGPDVLPAYQLLTAPFAFSVLLRPVAG